MKNTLPRWLDSDVGHSFRTSPMAMRGGPDRFRVRVLLSLCRLGGAHNPFDLATLNLGDARCPGLDAEGVRHLSPGHG